MTITERSHRPEAKPLALVTGASSGIGYELARQFASHGYDVLAVAEDGGLTKAAGQIAALGADVLTFSADLATYDGVEELYRAVHDLTTERGRDLEVVALNAGVGVGGDFSRDTELADELRLIDLNVSGTVHLAKRVLHDMVEKGHGKVLITSSIAATQPGPFEAVYAASKAFLLSFSEALRSELKDTDVTVTALMPGPTKTNFFHRAGMDDTRAGSGHQDDPAEVAEQAYKAVMSGTGKVVAGSVANKVMAATARATPDRVKAAAHRVLSRPGSGDPAKSRQKAAEADPTRSATTTPTTTTPTSDVP